MCDSHIPQTTTSAAQLNKSLTAAVFDITQRNNRDQGFIPLYRMFKKGFS